ncbi:Cupin domain protein [Gemmata sp. SH-PL17]|nr:Cupin domain protein [Gemmata sp. SH-PL17]
MTLAPGEAGGGPDNCYEGTDQWLYVTSGTGVAVVESRRVELSEGTLVLIPRGERHEVRNTGDAPLRTLNVYVPRRTRPMATNYLQGNRIEDYSLNSSSICCYTGVPTISSNVSRSTALASAIGLGDRLPARSNTESNHSAVPRSREAL